MKKLIKILTSGVILSLFVFNIIITASSNPTISFTQILVVRVGDDAELIETENIIVDAIHTRNSKIETQFNDKIADLRYPSSFPTTVEHLRLEQINAELSCLQINYIQASIDDLQEG